MQMVGVRQSSERWHLRFAFVFVWTNTPICFSSIWSYQQYQVGSHISCTNKSASGGSPPAVSAAQLCCNGIRRQIQPGWSRSQPGVTKWHKEESRRNCGNHKKSIINYSVDGLFLTMYGLRLQPQQRRCLHLGLVTTWLAMNRPLLGWGVIIIMNAKVCSVYRDSKCLAPTHTLTLCTTSQQWICIHKIFKNLWWMLNVWIRCNWMPFFQEILIWSKYGSLHRKLCDSMKKTKCQHLHLSTWLKRNKRGSRK